MCKLFLSVLLLLAPFTGVVCQVQTTAAEGEQRMFVIDNSSSMDGPAFGPSVSGSRWNLVQKHFPEWLGRIPDSTFVGAVSAGGPCGSTPSIRLPIGSQRADLLTAVNGASPNGETNLNAVLQSTPSLFDLKMQGPKHVVLLSDGQNTCQPNTSTCDLTRNLHRDYGITIDVVALITDPQMANEFKCIAETSGGQFITPTSPDDWSNITLSTIDPWRYVVLVLGLLTLLFASTILYRHVHHVMRWTTGLATMMSGVFLIAGSLLVYITLFARAGLISAALGLGISLTVSVVAVIGSKPRRLVGRSVGVLLLIGSACLVQAQGQTRPTMQCSKVVSGTPRYHHLLAIDLSGSVAAEIEQMKALLACYGEMYTLPGEEVSLIAFGLDKAGSVKELRTFTIPSNGSTEILDQLLEDQKIQDARETKTYFKPLADFLNGFLAHVRMEPIVITVSDGLSDGYKDLQNGLISFPEVPFESFGTRGIYSAPQMKDWRVGVQGGSGIDLSPLFQKPLVGTLRSRREGNAAARAVQPCLIDPQLVAQADPVLTLAPGWNPFGQTVHGKLALNVRNECATRFRSFKVELLLGETKYPIGSARNVLVDDKGQTLEFDVSLPNDGNSRQDGIIQLVLEQAAGNRTIYPQNPASIAVTRVGYVNQHAPVLGLLALGVVAVLAAALLFIRSRRVKERTSPEYVKITGGPAVALDRNRAISIGGDNCNLVIAGVPAGVTLAHAEWHGVRGQLHINAEPGVKMKIAGVEVEGNGVYRVEQTLQFTEPTNAIHEVILHTGGPSDVAFVPTAFANDGLALDFSDPATPNDSYI